MDYKKLSKLVEVVDFANTLQKDYIIQIQSSNAMHSGKLSITSE